MGHISKTKQEDDTTNRIRHIDAKTNQEDKPTKIIRNITNQPRDRQQSWHYKRYSGRKNQRQRI